MKHYLAPLGVFALGNLALLGLFLFLNAISDAAAPLTANATYNATFWGWEWIGGGTKIWVVLFGELIVIIGAAITFLKTKNS